MQSDAENEKTYIQLKTLITGKGQLYIRNKIRESELFRSAG